MSGNVPRCVMCNCEIRNQETYFFDEDHEDVICDDCIFDYIQEEYTIEQVLMGALDIQKHVCVMQRAEASEKDSVKPIDGQMDIFGDVYRDERMRDEP